MITVTTAYDDYYDEHGLRRKTDFKENGFGIDPEGCGCTDCITGQSFNLVFDAWKIEKALRSGRTLYNRTGHEIVLSNGVRVDDGQAWRPGNPNHCPGCNCATF